VELTEQGIRIIGGVTAGGFVAHRAWDRELAAARQLASLDLLGWQRGCATS